MPYDSSQLPDGSLADELVAIVDLAAICLDNRARAIIKEAAKRLRSSTVMPEIQVTQEDFGSCMSDLGQ